MTISTGHASRTTQDGATGRRLSRRCLLHAAGVTGLTCGPPAIGRLSIQIFACGRSLDQDGVSDTGSVAQAPMSMSTLLMRRLASKAWRPRSLPMPDCL
jgi:hypothetical protein